MPTEKRARQRALRNQKMAIVERQRKRRRMLRRAGSAVVVAGLVVGLVFLLSSHPAKPKKAAVATTTTAKTTTTTTVPKAAAVCPPASGSTKRVISFATAPKKLCISPDATYDATVVTDVGKFVIQMPAAASLQAVNNFVFLARYHFYDSTVFQRVIPGYIVQGGDPTGTGKGGPGYSFTGNTPKAGCGSHCYALGAVAMANVGGKASTDESQFFIVAGPAAEALPPSYTSFGQVISGMSVVQKIAADGNSTPADSGVPPKVLHHIVKVTITEASPS